MSTHDMCLERCKIDYIHTMSKSVEVLITILSLNLKNFSPQNFQIQYKEAEEPGSLYSKFNCLSRQFKKVNHKNICKVIVISPKWKI